MFLFLSLLWSIILVIKGFLIERKLTEKSDIQYNLNVERYKIIYLMKLMQQYTFSSSCALEKQGKEKQQTIGN